MATTATKTFDLQRQRFEQVVLSGEGATIVADGTGGGDASPCKRAYAFQWTVGAQDVAVLVRLEAKDGRLYVDLCAGSSSANMQTRVNDLDLTSVAPGHPSPLNDGLDDTATAAAQ